MAENATRTFPDQSMVLPAPWTEGPDNDGPEPGALKQTPVASGSAASTPSAGDVAANDIWSTLVLPNCITPTFVLLAAKGQTITAHNLAAVTD